MKKLNRTIFLLVAFCSCLLQINAQSSDTKIETLLNKYRGQNVNEKLFAHTDKDFYLAGEILWFKLYYVEGSLHIPLDLSKVAYVELLDKDHKPVLQSKIALAEGSGTGSLYLPLSLNSGVYSFRAYTLWMKNFSADYFFEKSFTIVNSTKSLERPSPQPVGFDIGFFPEGGSLVQNLQSKVAFRIADLTGRGIHCKGILTNQNNDTVAVFQPLKFGIGHFMFTPKAGDNYKAVITLNDTTVIKELPKVREQGFVINMSKENENTLRVRVTTNSQVTGTVYLIIHARQLLKISDQKTLNNGVADFIVDKNKMGDGVSHITIFNDAKQPLCERLYFIRPANQLKIESSAGSQFQSRVKVAVQIFSKDESGIPVPADLSVSVHKADPSSSYEAADISSYFWLTSDLRGNVESPGYYFSDNGAEVEQAIDNLMLTHGWRRFLWQDLVNNANVPVHFIPEFRGHIIHAKITNSKTGLPAAGILTYLSVPGKRVQLYSSKSDAAGILKFYTKDFYASNEILLQTYGTADSSYRIEITSPFSEKFSAAALPVFEIPEKLKEPLVDNSVNMQVQNIFSGEKLKQLFIPAIDSNGFYGVAEHSYMLDNYVRFSTMEEVLREYVVEVLVRRQKENFRLMIAGGLENRVFLDDPITLFNGVPVFETNKIMQYDPLKIQKIEVVNKRYFYGSSILNGIVNFTTYQPDPEMVSGLNAVVFDYEGLQFEREFYSPVYETQGQLISRLPDFRNVLYWSSDIKTSSQGKTDFSFYTSDQKGKYIVVIQGMNKDGKTGAQVFSFTVK